ncbi:hypothetical protein B0J14DRAFT_698745 [Halenospora varia]|nr:hypothetical protein B0J14DRAFT_698745 [Halenospora varia]
MSEAWPLMLATVHRLACLPRLEEQLTWLPLDVAAQAILGIARNETKTTDGRAVESIMLSTIPGLQMKAGKLFDTVELDVWIGRLEALGSDPAQSLIGLWRSVYGEKRGTGGEVEQAEPVTFGVENAQKVSPAMRDVPVVDQRLFEKI